MPSLRWNYWLQEINKSGKGDKQIKIKFNWKKPINPIPCLIFCLIAFGYAIFIFSMGLHNVDLAYNLALITNDNNLDKAAQNLPLLDYRAMLDTTLGDRIITYPQAFRMGLSQMIQGTIAAIFTAIFFTLLLNHIPNTK